MKSKSYFSFTLSDSFMTRRYRLSQGSTEGPYLSQSISVMLYIIKQQPCLCKWLHLCCHSESVQPQTLHVLVTELPHMHACFSVHSFMWVFYGYKWRPASMMQVVQNFRWNFYSYWGFFQREVNCYLTDLFFQVIKSPDALNSRVCFIHIHRYFLFVCYRSHV